MDKKKRRRVVEIDTDGVLANMDGSYQPYVVPFLPDFTEEKYIRTWAMTDIADHSPEALEEIHKLWTDPEFVRTLPRFDGVVEGLKILGNVPGLDVVIHTHIRDKEECVRARYQWLEELAKEAGVKVTIDICVGDKKQMRTDSYYVVEDCVRNLNNSSAHTKFLVRRCHNRDFTIDDVVGGEEAYLVKSFREAALFIREDMKNF